MAVPNFKPLRPFIARLTFTQPLTHSFIFKEAYHAENSSIINSQRQRRYTSGACREQISSAYRRIPNQQFSFHLARFYESRRGARNFTLDAEPEPGSQTRGHRLSHANDDGLPR